MQTLITIVGTILSVVGVIGILVAWIAVRAIKHNVKLRRQWDEQ